ncbi:MAG: hypothetical protein ABI317_05370 [Gaiellales bacterium]
MRTWELLSDLPIDVEGYHLDPHEIPFPHGEARRTTVVRLLGGGFAGSGEDVGYDADAQLVFQDAGAHQPLVGATTLAGFSRLLDGLELWPGAESDPNAMVDYRRWAFESAALDLALHQSGLSLAGALGREPQPLRFGASLGLGDPPDASRVRGLLARYPTTRFKLDATSGWTRTLADELHATGAIDVVDLKGYYVGTVVDQPADPVLYRLIVEAFPDAIIEDARYEPAVAEILLPERARLSFDAPIHSIGDAQALPFAPAVLNSKPSRFGTLERLLDFYDWAAEEGIELYGGGQWELAVGRDQIQLLAALFHPDGPNDVAPRRYNAAEIADDLPTSPLELRPSATGFGLS